MVARPFRFALTVGDAADRSRLAELARRAEDAGFAVLAGVDHVGGALGVIPLLSVLAEISPLRLSTMVVANDHRHPALLARDTATLDVLSGGRFELGIGTGWIADHYRAIGIELDPPGVRVRRLAEAVEVIKGCWTAEPFAFDGDHYRVDLTSTPRPVQRPHPPLMIAGSGPAMMRLAGARADIVSITVTRGLDGFAHFGAALAGSALQIERQLAWIAEGVGGHAEPERNVMIHHHAASDAALADFAADVGGDPATASASPHVLAGDVEQMVDALVERRERWGISYITVRGAQLDRLAPVVTRLAGA